MALHPESLLDGFIARPANVGNSTPTMRFLGSVQFPMTWINAKDAEVAADKCQVARLVADND